MGRVRRMLRNQCPVGLPGHYKAEKVFADVEMPARPHLGAHRASANVVRRGNCVSADSTRLRARTKRLRSRERGQGGTQRNYSF